MLSENEDMGPKQMNTLSCSSINQLWAKSYLTEGTLQKARGIYYCTKTGKASMPDYTHTRP